MPLICCAFAVCQQTDRQAGQGGLDGVDFQNPACKTELLASAAHGHRPFAWICIPMLTARRAIQLLLLKNVALAGGLGCANDTKALPF